MNDWTKNGSIEPSPFDSFIAHHDRIYDKDAEEKSKDDIKQKIAEKKLLIVRSVIPALLRAGANIDEVDYQGKTALVIADKRDEKSLKQALLENGANEFDLKRWSPDHKYLIDQKDERNISHHHSKFYELSDEIISGVKNKFNNINSYPFVTLNSDNSVSLIFSEDNSQLIEFLQQDYVIEQFKFHARENHFKIIGENDVYEIRHSIGSVECKFNLSPDDLDAIMKLNSKYLGYRNEGSITKLNRDFVMKDGFIRVFPVFAIDESKGIFSVQAAGCQVTEMPTIQLMHLLPNYESEIVPNRKINGNSFHWMPKEIGEGLMINRLDITNILNRVFIDNGIFINDVGNSGEFMEHPDILKITDSDRMCDVRIVSIDEDSKDFYLMYGNFSLKELANCQSVEIRTTALLNAIGNRLDEKVFSGYLKQEDISKAKSNIELMLSKQISREEPSSSPIDSQVSAVSTSKCSPRIIS